MHRLAAYPDPFDSSAQAWSVSPAFNVIANSSQSSTGVVGASTSILPTNTSTSTSRSNNHNTIIIAVVVVCVVLALVILGLLLLLRRRRRRKNAEMSDIGRPRSVLDEDLGPSGAATLNAPPSDIARFNTGPVSRRHEKMVNNGYLVPQRSLPDRRPDESNPPLSDAGSGSTWAVPESSSDREVSQRLQRTEAELEALRAEVRTLTQPPPSYFPE
ncbi:hypothetical protein C8J57DRAFT_453203 [Mycena rebaudengoi]|nr:hypothetical protein C8J57DRAFT_453203 [Mycena rebaudengoi]